MGRRKNCFDSRVCQSALLNSLQVVSDVLFALYHPRRGAFGKELNVITAARRVISAG
ncbi:Hypothetical protein ABZS17G119_00163 [Kosakonia cowanii]